MTTTVRFDMARWKANNHHHNLSSSLREQEEVHPWITQSEKEVVDKLPVARYKSGARSEPRKTQKVYTSRPIESLY